MSSFSTSFDLRSNLANQNESDRSKGNSSSLEEKANSAGLRMLHSAGPQSRLPFQQKASSGFQMGGFSGGQASLFFSRLETSPSKFAFKPTTQLFKENNPGSLFSDLGFSSSSSSSSSAAAAGAGDPDEFRMGKVRSGKLNVSAPSKSLFVEAAKKIKALSFKESLKLEMDGQAIQVAIEEFLGRGDFSEAYRCKIGMNNNLVIGFFREDTLQNKEGKKTDHYLFNKLSNYSRIRDDRTLRNFYSPHINFDLFIAKNKIDKQTVKSNFKDGFILTDYIPYALPHDLNSQQAKQLVDIINAHISADIPMDIKRANLRCDAGGNICVIDIYELETSMSENDGAYAEFKTDVKSIAAEGSELYKALMSTYEKAAGITPDLD